MYIDSEGRKRNDDGTFSTDSSPSSWGCPELNSMSTSEQWKYGINRLDNQLSASLKIGQHRLNEQMAQENLRLQRENEKNAELLHKQRLKAIALGGSSEASTLGSGSSIKDPAADGEFPISYSPVRKDGQHEQPYKPLTFLLLMAIIALAGYFSFSDFPLTRITAQLGNLSDQYCLGEAYGEGFCRGTSIKKNPEKAFYWYKKAADQGGSTAERVIGRYYAQGFGTEKNVVNAAKYLTKASAQGDMLAMHYLGLLYFYGIGVDADREKAAALILKSAEKGLMLAKRDISVLYTKGIGVPVDSKKARYWAKQYLERAERVYKESGRRPDFTFTPREHL